MSATAFHAHLDGCRQCAEDPFNLCPTGARLLERAAASANSGTDLTWADVERATEKLKATPPGLGAPRFCGLGDGPGSAILRYLLDPGGECEGGLGWQQVGPGSPPMGLCDRHRPLVAQAMGVEVDHE